MEDKRIIEMYWQRDEQALTLTRHKYGAYCHTIAWQILHSREDADECENDTYLRAWNAMPPDRPQGLRAYLGAITRRLSLDRWRERKSQKRGGGEVALSLDELGECVTHPDTVPETVDAAQTAAVLSTFLRSLPPAECDVFLRRYWYFDSVAQIAKRFGYSESKVKMTLSRTRDKLRVCLEKEGICL
jgi:RNA polymerase sigma-70 factor (ECF subfamily)